MSTDREPLYIQIQNHFKEIISSRRLKEDDRIPTEKEILEQFNVSRLTVANAMNELAREGWIYRIPGRGSYVKGIPETFIPKEKAVAEAAAPSIPSRPKIGLVFPFVNDYFAIRLIRGITQVLENNGYSLVLMFTFDSKEKEKEAIREMKDDVEGLIIFPADAEVYNEDIISLKIANYPFVLIDRYLPGVETNAVHSDSGTAMKMAIDHLWNLGHRNIAICSDSPQLTVSVDDRINGYINALRAKGAMINPALFLTDFSAKPGAIDPEHPLFRFVKNKLATAYIALNGDLGVHIWSVAKKAGLQVPDDLSIVTFDNPSPHTEFISPFTYINQSEEEIGQEAARLLLDVIKAKGQPVKPQRIVMQPVLVAGETTGAPSKV
ncbi:GntR family transcriptional regulator of arabinose operon [Paenibacillus taihuensis]|uniref:GntR family transcriptional regulator of arabinose operon n=1 Tax=Paenibacillus taihuensis TaxID=1156355 RepID=A0A3D9RN19_9BACL|nr:GntR family transcriptional regulator [Paenibacillus taihuensis]REE80968.1 GntR family transcriptional regulator of arabinose operon [Paenibacillus taihuensis]